MKIFITGAEGFFGSHLTEFLLKNGFKVSALIQYNSFHNHGWLEELKKSKKKTLNFYLAILEIVLLFLTQQKIMM